ncbi:polyphosphate kinase 1 [Dysgonomonas sp. Marseille-P4361]|uniref:polyphosphate kinase 1 n=1 Tax=Dysgonomonas sp. Marseille-P4361 TaxID=2161820 RepID=UPI000D54D3E5|nr:polyphosphate kinase 1 [Dysgonomonas sp. Marseille-P4361]
MINNRDLSWLTFNERVLQEAQDETVPLLQRLRFLGIFSNNQDEFIKVRVANIVRLSQLKEKKVSRFTGGYTAQELLPLVNQKVAESQQKFTDTYEEILAQMGEQGIYVLNEKQLSKKQKEFCYDYFSSVVSPQLVPLILRKTTQIPFLQDNNIYHAVKMTSRKDGKNARYAILQIPVNTSCPRFVVLPSSKDKKEIIFLDDIIRLNLDDIFFMFNYESIAAYTFKLMRDSSLTLDDDLTKSLLEKMEVGLENRLHGQPVRLIYDREMPDDLLGILATKLKLDQEGTLDAGGRYHLLRDLMKFPKIRPNLEEATFVPLKHPDIKPFSSICKVINKKDIFLNYPYHTFNHFIDFLREAAIDPKVDSISITLYRTAERSKVINALLNAAKNGKKVVVLLELFARFDEEQNVEYTELLQRHGVKVIHGTSGIKVHSKLVLVQRKDKGYVFVGTGNFNESTAQIYGDYGLFTSNPEFVEDAKAVFDYLQNAHKRPAFKQLVVSPDYMRDHFEGLIKQEIKNKQNGKDAFICAKLNSLTDERIIKLLYKASQAGIEVRLIVRGACCLQPQVKGMSENIRVISIVDKFLEHARMAIFCNGGEEKMYIMSADWMNRNLDRRVEIAAPVLDEKIRQTLRDVFEIQWSDNEKARDLSVFGCNRYVERGDNPSCRSQVALYDYYKKM